MPPIKNKTLHKTKHILCPKCEQDKINKAQNIAMLKALSEIFDPPICFILYDDENNNAGDWEDCT